MRPTPPLATCPPLILSLLIASALPAQETARSGQLAEHTAEFEKGVIEVTDGVHVAIGFGLANSILIEGDDGVIIVDTMESSASAAAVKKEFQKITDKPVKAIIYTHNHYDHIQGASVFAGEDRPDVYAHQSTMRIIQHSLQVMQGAIRARSMRQFGVPLRGQDFLNAGIGPRLVLDLSPGRSFLPPNHVVGEEPLAVEISGVKLEIVPAPGETEDQIYVWLPEKKVLMPGDNFYKAFPNLYAIRGTRFRDPGEWVTSLDDMIAREPEFLVPSHTRPLIGRDKIKTALGNYRDGIKSVLDQTIAGMNAGLTPDELVQQVKLPDHLADDPNLQEYYGTVEWSVRSIFAGNLGWFDGNATNLFQLSDKERAERIAKLAGGNNALLEQAQAALQDKDYRWTAELADHLIALGAFTKRAHVLKADALTALGHQQVSANARNYYLTSAQQLRRAAQQLAAAN